MNPLRYTILTILLLLLAGCAARTPAQLKSAVTAKFRSLP